MPRRHSIQMGFAIVPAKNDRYEMYFTHVPPEQGEFYWVQGASTNIISFLRDFERAFANIDDKTFTRDECEAFIRQNSDTFAFERQEA